MRNYLFLDSNTTLLRARVRGISREALAGTSRGVADSTVRALGNILVGTLNGGEELVYSKIGNIISRGTSRVSESAVSSPVSGQISGDDMSHVVQAN